MTDHQYDHIGKLLRVARENARISLHEAAQALHIRSRYLEALEEGRFSDLPGLPYVKGYLQSYANLLELDRAEIMRQMEQVEQLVEKRALFIPEVLRAEKKPHIGLIWGALLVVFAVYVMWWAVSESKNVPISVVEPFNLPPLASQRFIEEHDCALDNPILYPACVTPKEENFMFLPFTLASRYSIMVLGAE